MYFIPRVDGEYLPEDPATLVLDGRHAKIDLMAGIVADEGALLTNG